MNKLLTGVSAFAQELPGKFEGVTIDAKLIGGQQYENLYLTLTRKRRKNWPLNGV